ncbi:hypothetical protein [Arsenophonus sp. ENCA]|uniref:hypothetical protein n=1 Tax=Arsenophonus sp. ENCA TaxID=1987579 RepID=UPI0025BEE080|nr:hypothetical protein [Arsenophonus sp. ENCA]
MTSAVVLVFLALKKNKLTTGIFPHASIFKTFNTNCELIHATNLKCSNFLPYTRENFKPASSLLVFLYLNQQPD